jgi:hypothetical protein
MTYSRNDYQLLYAFRFFSNSKITVEERTFANILDILSFVGGLQVFLMIPFEFMGSYISEKTVQGKFIRSLYFVKDSSNSISMKNRVNTLE